MQYDSLEDCLLYLEKKGQLVRIKEEVDPNLEMAAIHLRVHEANGPALLFEKVKGIKVSRCFKYFRNVRKKQNYFWQSPSIYSAINPVKK